MKGKGKGIQEEYVEGGIDDIIHYTLLHIIKILQHIRIFLYFVCLENPSAVGCRINDKRQQGH